MTRWCDGPLLGFDLETTGVDPFKDVPVSYALVRAEGAAVVATVGGLVDPGRPIPPGAVAVHGISTERARRDGEPLDVAVERIAGQLVAASQCQVPVVGMNVRFDLTIVDACLRRAGGTGLRERGWRGPVVDLLVLDRHVDRWRKGSRKLGDLCTHYGVELADAHQAAADVEATVRCVLALVRERCELGDMDVVDLDAAQVDWYREWAVGLNEWRVGKGHPPFPDHEYLWPLAMAAPVG